MSAVVKFNPFNVVTPIDSMFDDLMRRTFPTIDQAVWTPAADLARDGEDMVITMELPGITAGDLNIEMHGRTLVISGQRTSTLSDTSGAQILRREIRRGAFSRVFRLPSHISSEAIEASYTDGILTVRVPGATPNPTIHKIPIAGLAYTGSPVETKAVESAATDA